MFFFSFLTIGYLWIPFFRSGATNQWIPPMHDLDSLYNNPFMLVISNKISSCPQKAKNENISIFKYNTFTAFTLNFCERILFKHNYFKKSYFNVSL